MILVEVLDSKRYIVLQRYEFDEDIIVKGVPYAQALKAANGAVSLASKHPEDDTIVRQTKSKDKQGIDEWTVIYPESDDKLTVVIEELPETK